MPKFTKSLAAATVIFTGLGLSGCATTDYVDEQIALVNSRIDGVDAQLRTTTQTANTAQTTAQAAATDAQNANRRLDALTGRVDRVEQQSTAQRSPRN